LPRDIKANSTTRIDLKYAIDMDEPIILDRCLPPIDIRNPKKIEENDLPLAVNFILNHTFGTLEIKGCVFRKDQPESQLRAGDRGTYFYSRTESSKEKPQFLLVN
jgi:hypothetical protein